MQVKTYEASSIIDALKQVKKELGPDAIILSTEKSRSPISGLQSFKLVAAVSETHLKKKEIAVTKLGGIFEKKVESKSAQHQKVVIDNVYKNIEKKVQKKSRTITATPYIDIEEDSKLAEVSVKSEGVEVESGQERVKKAAQDALKSSLTGNLFGRRAKEPEEDQLSEDQLSDILKNSKQVIQKTSNIQAQPQSQDLDDMVRRLKSCGVDSQLVHNLAEQVKAELGNSIQRKAIVDSWFAKWILDSVPVTRPESNAAVEIFVGPHGMGKTTALVKLAAHYVINMKRKVALVTTDMSKVGAVEQLRVYGRILNLPVYIVKDSRQLEEKINQLGEYSSVLVDTPGISLGNIDELDFVRSLATVESGRGKSIHLVLSALTKNKDLGSVLKRFRVAQFDDIVVSNIDQTSQHGILLNIQSKTKVPFHSFGIGSDVVDGFEFASKERVLDLIFKLTKINGEKSYGDIR